MIRDRNSPLAEILTHLETVPPAAQVSVGARCARRVEPLFGATAGLLRAAHRDAVLTAVTVVEEVACGRAHTADHLAAVHENARTASRHCLDVYPDDHHPSRRSSACITYAARAALRYVGGTPPLSDVCYAADRTAQAARDAPWMVDAITSDIKTLLAGFSRRGKRPTFLVSSFGDLWPRGEPPGWPDAVTHSANGFKIEETVTKNRLRRRLAIVTACLEWPDGEPSSPAAIWKRLGGEKALGCTAKTVENDLKSLSKSLGCDLLAKNPVHGRARVLNRDAKARLADARLQLMETLRAVDT